MWFFFRTILGTLKNLCLPQNVKQDFIFFPTWKKKQNKATTQCCEKLAIWFSNRLQIPSKPDPPRSLHRIEGGGTGSQKGEGGTISYHLFLGCISFQTYQRKSFRSLSNSHPLEAYCHASESRPPFDHPLTNFVIFGHSLISALKKAKLQCQLSVVFLRQQFVTENLRIFT